MTGSVAVSESLAVGEVVWLDGRLVAADEARVSAFDHGLTVGDGVFETMQVRRSRPVALRRHLWRLRASAAGLGLPVPPDDDLAEAARSLIEANRVSDDDRVRLRLTLTGGPGPLGTDRGQVAPTVLLALAPLPPNPSSIDVVTVSWRRNEHSAVAGLKTTSYAENVVALAAAHRAGAAEAVLANTAGDLCEGTGSNVFVVVDGQLTTPPLTSGCLAGITRALVSEVVPVVERPLPFGALASADEAFITSSTRDVMPVHRVDGRALPACPGPLTGAAADALAALLARDLDP
jgi:branched-chain amino acid aminotransferase